MEREYKSLAFTNIKAESKGRVRGGIAAVFGNIDAVNDRITAGAFIRTIENGAKRARHLWNHSYEHPPIASIKELRELTRDELPAEVLAKAPEATGGLLVRREYYAGVPLADWVLAGVDAGDINEMSFAYEVVRSRTLTEPEDDDPEKTREVRELQELRLFDTSDVLWGCNSATVAAGAKVLNLLPLGALASQLLMLREQLKAGRRNSDSDQKLIDLIHTTSVGLGAICPGSQDLEDTGKAKNSDNTSEKPGPADFSTPLSSDWLRIREIELANFTDQ